MAFYTPVPNPAGTTWRRRAAVTTWTKGTTAGRSFTPTSSGSRRARACSAPCWASGPSSSLSPPVSRRRCPTRFEREFWGPSGELTPSRVPDRHHRHGALRHVQRAPPRLHQLGRHRAVRSDQLRVRIRVVQLLHADRRPSLGVEHHPHLVALLR